LSALTDTLRRYRARVEHALDVRLPPATVAPQRLHEAMRYATLNGGKRVRAALVYAAGEAVGADPDVLDTPACAVELIHAYSLVHDDLPCMDDDDLRRGKPSCHRAFDEATALLAGDALQTRAFEILAADPNLNKLGAESRLCMLATLARAAGADGMAGGQAIDLASVGRALTAESLQDMHGRKTGALIHGAVLLGALAAPDVDRDRVAALEAYGHAVGLAFQIVDDILDVEGSTEALGKIAGADQRRRKPTYPAVLGLAESRARAAALHRTALESLSALGDNAGSLAELASFIIERNQ
jgi:geranylgeranyl pyrophosphate synthase